ncbi:Remorin family protein putative isoform 1 [Tripterygium wilfordii]|uniref:Remorin family protein putative isoform 1 n=1 Tax=Tripterygium wilfordii TaxID=458696 RepID=A0A7J7CVQ2_TRIWF|nr:uncharacterized protein LOC120011959 isoform X2 [Tripterygium wilfordii]KAF5738215.1 Remorin family protein putative isoform 1 [Tripterygium wilfordii]
MNRASSSSAYNLGTILSPGVLDYQDNSMDGNKGWSSERVPRHSSGGSRRHISAATLTPFYSGRTMPSKWDDAERWICSPLSGYGGAKSLNFQSQRRQKSKSGPIPIVPQGIGFYSNSSPAMQVLDGDRVRNFVVAESPFSTGVFMPGGIPQHYRGLVGNDNSFAQSTAPTRWTDLASESSLPGALDEKVDDMRDAETMVSPAVSRRDMATQMSPNSTSSSPRGRPSSPPFTLPDDHPARMEIREVQVDKRATIISSPERGGPYSPKKGFPDDVDFNQNAPSACFSSWETSETATNVSKLQREEARITAWENLQQAKAEAAIRKLEMKLEKKRSSSMDKILNNLRISHKKAQEMRNSISDRQDNQSSKTYHKVTFLSKHAKISSLKSCFTCCYVL